MYLKENQFINCYYRAYSGKQINYYNSFKVAYEKN